MQNCILATSAEDAAAFFNKIKNKLVRAISILPKVVESSSDEPANVSQLGAKTSSVIAATLGKKVTYPYARSMADRYRANDMYITCPLSMRYDVSFNMLCRG